MKLSSIFGAYAVAMQLMIDRSKDRFAPLWFPKYFSWAPPQATLTYTTVIGASRIEAAASIVDRDGETPLRSRDKLSKLSGEIPAIKEMFKMSETDYRDYMAMQAMTISDEVKKKQILDLIYGDVLKVGNAAMKRLDIMCLEAVSKGQISITIDNNPDGLVLTDPIDLLMPAENKKQAAVTWATSASSTPITDIETVVKAGRDKGVLFSKILMTDALWMKFKKAKEVVDTMTAYFYGPKPGGGFNPIAISTLDKVNEFMTANRLPVIEIVEATIGIEKDGKISTISPFSENNASFIPSDSLGVIKNTPAIEEMRPVQGVSYAKYNNALISKWSQNEPFGEWTKSELNAFPGFESIESVFILTAVF